MNSNITQHVKGILAGQSRPITKAITLVESSLPSDVTRAAHLLSQLSPHSGKALRIGISGIPGVGKSTFIEKFGILLINLGMKIGVLAVDPTSPVSGGSIMGDRTRMEMLSAHTKAFVRPSPTGNASGGVARKTREAALILDAANYDVILIETVGVGQSEIAVASMVDVFLVLQMPSTGDDIQSIKKGILEVADIIAINKADGELVTEARIARSYHQKAFALVRTHSDWVPPVSVCSAFNNEGITEIWDNIQNFLTCTRKSGAFEKRRNSQLAKWFDAELNFQIDELITQDPSKEKLRETLRSSVLKREIAPVDAARQLARSLFIHS